MADERDTRPEVDEAEMMQQLREELQNLTVGDHLFLMMRSLSALAVEKMGLGGEAGAHLDLGEARLAIDAFKALVELMEKSRPVSEMAGHRDVLSQLQLAYVGALNCAPATGEEAAATDKEPGATDKEAAAAADAGDDIASAGSEPPAAEEAAAAEAETPAEEPPITEEEEAPAADPS